MGVLDLAVLAQVANFDVTSSLKASDNVWDKRAFSSLSALKLLSSMGRGVWDKSELLTMLVVCFGSTSTQVTSPRCSSLLLQFY